MVFSPSLSLIFSLSLSYLHPTSRSDFLHGSAHYKGNRFAIMLQEIREPSAAVAGECAKQFGHARLAPAPLSC